MSFLDLLCGGVKCRILVLDNAYPDEAFSIERRVSRSAYKRYAVNGVLFASITEKIDPTFHPGFELAGKAYAFMPYHLGQELASQCKSTRNLNLEPALQNAIDVPDRIVKGPE
jgi:hypothetical protein